jgi:hypothetical protein
MTRPAIASACLSPARRRAIAQAFVRGVTVERLAYETAGFEGISYLSRLLMVEDAVRWTINSGQRKRRKRRKAKR